MSTSDMQAEFLIHVAKFIIWATEEGYKLTGGDLYRDPRVHGKFGKKESYSSPNSYHKRRLAIDFNLFIDGEYQKSTEAFRPLGEKWKSMHPLATWGGDFRRPDGNHFSWGESR